MILKLPYSRFIDEEENHQYVDLLHHAVTQTAKDSDDDSSEDDTAHEALPKHLAVSTQATVDHVLLGTAVCIVTMRLRGGGGMLVWN